MRQIEFLSRIFLILLIGSVTGAGVVAAEPTGKDPTLMAVYGATVVPTAVSSVAAMTTTWEKHEGAWASGLNAVMASISSLSGGKAAPDVVLQVALANPKNGEVIQIKDYPLDYLRSVIDNPKFGFSLEIAPAKAPLKGKQDFSRGLVIYLKFPPTSKPFFLKADKKTPVFLSEMLKDPKLLPGFDGDVTLESDGRYLLKVNYWTAGDPCGGG